ncbi:MAG: AAA family ATPase [Devosia sp.]|uniref:AAA family ATPase n=1 Tax=Devosia sp. TaxID=1871048 RepID=UPI001A4435E4|nr:AAA family ATPase [Devosia sp.]MBL8597779.1 AAA family ATPase [Devosia sp.]
MTFDQFGPDDEDDDVPAALKATAYEILPATLLKSIVTPNQMERIGDDGSLCLAIVVPTVEWVQPILTAITSWGEFEYRVTRSAAPKSRATDDGVSQHVTKVLARGGRVVGVAASLDHLPAALRTSADLTIVVPPPSGAVVKAVIDAVAGPGLTRIEDDVVGALGFEQIVACLRAGSTAQECVDRLVRIGGARNATDAITADVPDLDQLHGYGDAMIWAKQLVADLAAWRAGRVQFSDLETSVLLVSEPGLGKTSFVRSLARSTGLPLFATSVAQWFTGSTGYLDSVLKKIDELFSSARAVSPALVFLDEIDSLPDRARLDSRNRDYWTAVIAHVLTVLDGATTGLTKNLIIVAATNFEHRLDPALLRPGRISRTIRIGRPDEAALAGIIRQHLGDDLAGSDLSAAARLAHGATGADITGFVKTARATARSAGRRVAMSDLLDAIAPRDERDPDHLWRIAVHEAGHAVTAHEMKLGPIRSISIVARGNAGGFCHVEYDGYAPTRPILEDYVVQMLGGRAAEEAILGAAGTGAGGHAASDLASATRQLGLLHVALGLGGELLYRGGEEDVPRVLALDPRLAAAVEADLQRLYARALAIVRDQLPILEAIATELIKHRHIGEARFLAIVDAHNLGGQRNG